MPSGKGKTHGVLSTADLHIHSSCSDGIASVSDILEYVQSKTALSVIAIADHDTTRGASEARKLAAQRSYRFEIVSAVEISTNAGHLLALFVDRTVPYDEKKTLADYVREIHHMGGVCIVSHPMSRQKNSVTRPDLERLLANPDKAVHPDALETMEARVARITNTDDVEALNRSRYHLAEVGNSDAHALSIIANRYTLFPGKTAEDLRRAILSRTTRGWSGKPPQRTFEIEDT